MQFIRLRLNGFKSFVDQTDLAIQEGLTGVVGPNGCGKSNLLEALRWVMGESRPKSMRGGGMEDVIFAGTATRPARSFAEVSLQVDNAERLAPAAFNDADAIEIVRRITRDAGSAYKAAGRDVRARDVQMLFADASTGAQSPALVRQGQIAELIGARPTTRRRVLEEAAGISGLYQRRHEAELKLGGAEANLARLDDVIEQLAARRAQLARQARQAARYREVGAALRRAEGMLLHRRWREAEAAREAAGDALAARSAEAAGAEREAAAAVRTREAAEAAPPALREEAAIAAAVLSRLEADRARLADRARRAEEATQRLSGRLEQLGRDATREAALNDDADETIGRLEAEADALAAAEAGSETALAAARQAARQAGERLEACELALAAVSEDAARLSARHDASARAIEAARADGARAEAAAGSARSGVAEADAALAGAAEAQSGAEAERGAAEVEGQRAEAAQRDAETAQIGAREAEAETRIRRAEHEAERGAVQAEAAALAALLDREGGGGGRLIDLVEVAPGFEAALGAALADDLDQPVVESGTGWVRLADYDAVEPLPEGAAPLAARVRGPVVLARRIARVGVVEPASGPALQARLSPGQRLVSRAGDLWRWDGFVAAAQDGPGAAAVRLGQRNRLAELDRLRERVCAQTAAAIAAHEAAEAALARADAAVEEARAARRGADGRLAAAERALGHAAAERTLAEGRRAQAATAVARHEDDAREAGLRLAEADAELRGLADPDALRAEVADARRRVEAARTTMLARRADHDAQARAGEQRAARRSAIEEELATWRARRASASGRIEELAERRARTETELVAAREAPATLEAEGGRLAAALADAQARNAAAVEALTAGEGAVRQAAEAERAAERAAGAAREARAGAEAQAGAAGVAVAAAAARIAETLEETPAALERRLGEDADRMAPAADLEAELQRLRRQREGLGAINLRAEEDARAVEEEHGELVREKADLDSAIATLRAGIAGLNREGRERLRTAFETVNANFAGLFASLFGGGEARLELVESDDPLDAGLEILCQPPGKRLASLSLLSGGEQTLTAMALIFAVFLANPAPICVLDEVDAPLDDANVTRFCDLLDEMTRRTRTRFLIITHHAVTMARMDRLFGVTMGEQGVSQLVSVDLRRAEALVA